MKFGINNWVYNDEPVADTFARLAKFGYDAIELKGEPSLYSVEEINRLKQQHGMQVASVLGWCINGIPGRDLSNPDPAERESALRYGQQVTDFAAAVGAPVLIVLPFPAGRTGPVGGPQDEAEYLAAAQREWDNAVTSVQEAAKYAAQKGVTIAIEPINRYETYQLTTAESVLRFVEAVGAENVKVNLDTYHMNIDEKDLAGAIRKVGDRLVHMHCADSNREAPGRGHIDWKGVMQALRDVGFKGTMVLEPVPPGADPGIATRLSANLPLREIYAEEAIRYMKGIEQSL